MEKSSFAERVAELRKMFEERGGPAPDSRTRPRYYDLDGNPIDLAEWSVRFEDRGSDPEGEWRIGEDGFEDGNVRVSTVWLGLDHSFTEEGPPLIFETMIFGGPHDSFQRRYSTKEEAQKGHERVVEAIREGRDPNE